MTDFQRTNQQDIFHNVVALLGHSVGEYAAMYTAGSLNIHDALLLLV